MCRCWVWDRGPASVGFDQDPSTERTPVETDPIRMCELLVGLPEVRVLGVEQPDDGSRLVVHVACPEDWQRDCGGCGTRGWV